MVGFSLEKIQNKISNFFKSSVQTEIKKGSDPTGTGSPDNSGQDNLEILATEITGLLDDGTISPETEKIKKWAVSRGLSDDSAEDFANQVISAYFSEDDEDETDMAGKDDNKELEKDKNMKGKKKEGEENEDDEEDEDGVVKAALDQLSSLNDNQKLIMKGLETLTEAMKELVPRVEKMEQASKDMDVLKAKIGELNKTPASSKDPIIQAQTPADPTKSGEENSIPIMKSWIKSNFEKGNPLKISTNEVAALDSGYISPKLKELYKSERGNK